MNNGKSDMLNWLHQKRPKYLSLSAHLEFRRKFRYTLHYATSCRRHHVGVGRNTWIWISLLAHLHHSSHWILITRSNCPNLILYIKCALRQYSYISVLLFIFKYMWYVNDSHEISIKMLKCVILWSITEQR